ncbi:MAG: prefoldin subunit alpha [Thermoplasmata archaeon]|nr:prefoldin subunit alpha [Thermoplasmata archaeon]MCI4344568.1 prefoldin subunit alpha [Thermoplasmata archaeon]
MSAGRPIADAEQQVQEDLARLEAYRNQLSAMMQQYQYLGASRADHQRAREALEGLDRASKEAELLIPLGADTFLRGSAAPGAKVLLGVGSGVVMEADAPQVSEILAQRAGKIEAASKELEGQIGTLEQRIDMLQQRLEALARSTSQPATGDVGRD